MLGMHFTHPDQANVRKIRLPICVPTRQLSQARKMIAQDERGSHEPIAHERQHQGAAIEVERCFRQHRFAG